MMSICKMIPIYPPYVLLLASFFVGSVLGIIGGNRVADYPFFVKVEVLENVCGGTLVTGDAVLTAAHCLFHRAANRWATSREVLVLKNFDRSMGRPQEFSCDHFRPHELYKPKLNNGRGPFDIAVIQLKESVDLSDPQNGILEPCPRYTQYRAGVAIGLGLVRINPDTPAKTLMETRLQKYVPCNQFLQNQDIEILEEHQICFGSGRKGRQAGTCDGDYGGPIMLENFFIEEISCLIGVASFSNCDDLSVPSVFTNAGYFAAWIERTILTMSVPLPQSSSFWLCCA